ncbi:MAG: hypothetical protein HQL23_06180 [Candidatus Omnitrophica bacterium]|nr:hypothetical protein [Candidatus Omnitrophota bacterium]
MSAVAKLTNHRETLQKYFDEQRAVLTAFAYATTYSWIDFFNFDFRIIDGCLCIFAANAIGTFLYLPPLGKRVSRNVIRSCFAQMEERNGGSGVTRIENVPYEMLKHFPTDQYEFVPKNDEYIYWRQDIADYRGNDYKSKRSAYNGFVKNYPDHEYLPFEHGMMDECLGMCDVWASDRMAFGLDNNMYCAMIEEARVMNARLLRGAGELGLVGRVVRVKGKIRGYTFGFRMRDDMFCVLLEVTHPEYRGLPAYIFREFSDDKEVRPYKFLNVMDDCGAENLAWTKMSFRPTLLLKSYIVKKIDPRAKQFAAG